MKGDILFTEVGGEHVPVAALANIHAAAFAPSGERAWSASEMEELMLMSGTVALVAKRGDNILGFVMCRAVLDEAEILTFAVKPEEQGRGLASTMLRQLLGSLKSKGVVKVFLEVREDNSVAIQTYISAGFVKIGERAGYYETQNHERMDAQIFAFNTDSIDCI